MTLSERFLKYVSFPTMSDDSSDTVPTTKKQLALAKELTDELLSLGLSDAHTDDYGYVYATLPANTDKNVPVIGFIAHMDTSNAAADSPITPKTIEYNGGDILLNEEKNSLMAFADYP